VIKYVLSIFLILQTFAVMAQKAQKKSVVILVRSDRSENIKLNGEDVIKVFQGTFKQDYSIMRSDSAYFYPKRNGFDAFGHVNITQGDTLNIYSDKLNYNGNTKVAILTDNVRMIDKDAILTTNYLTYNTATRIGTYTGGGKLVNKENVLTSKNGYYFAKSRDAYFRYNVVLVTPDALIKTDTLRYSTATRISYFYGPTNIYDTKDKKDTLYTENGLYNTVVEQAFFGKNNLYKQGTKHMKGDSLFYDKVKGYGRAVKHVVFTDTEQKITMKGDLATYYKADERTIVTKDPYVIIVTEEKDTTTKADTTLKADSVVKGKAAKATSAAAKAASVNLPTVGSISVKSLSMPQLKTLAKDTAIKVPPAVTAKAKSLSMPQLKTLTKDTVIKIKPPAGTMPVKALSMPQLKTPVQDTVDKSTPAKEKVKKDSVYISADTLETQIMTYKNYKIMLENVRLASIRDTTIKVKKPAVKEKPSKFLTATYPKFRVDSAMFHRDFFGKLKAVAAKAKGPQRKAEPDPADNEPEIRPYKKVVLSDTARVRIVIAHHNAKLFKSDLQAKADSMFYSYSDSTIRCYVEPIIWTQGSQLSGDTIYMQMRNKKLDNLDMFPSALIVNIEKKDSIHFNQIAGKRMKGYFRNDKLDRMYVTGNAESIYFIRDSLQVVKEMQRSLSSRMRVRFKNNSAQNVTFLIQPDHKYAGLNKFTEDERILKNFMWKPKERPISKESILPSYGRKHNPPGTKTKTIKKPAGNPANKDEMAGDSTGVQSSREIPLTTGDDSTSVKPSRVIKKDSAGVKATSPDIKTKKDSAGVKTSAIEIKKDSTGVKATPPVIKAKKDSAGVKAAPPVINTKKDSVAIKKKP
jgi:lipopolysaccharide export system protein LptA